MALSCSGVGGVAADGGGIPAIGKVVGTVGKAGSSTFMDFLVIILSSNPSFHLNNAPASNPTSVAPACADIAHIVVMAGDSLVVKLNCETVDLSPVTFSIETSFVSTCTFLSTI